MQVHAVYKEHAVTDFAVLHVEDSFKYLTTMASKSVDVIITDPPYSEHVQNNLCSGSLIGTKNVPKYDLKFAPLTQYAWLQDCLRISRRWVIVFCAVEDFGHFQDAARPEYVRSCIWYKSNAMGQLTADRPASAYEGIAVLHPTQVKKRWNGRGSYGVWRCNGTRGKKDRHPNEKPVDLALKLVSLFSNPGELVLDPFCGSGAIGEAALKLGRNYIGLDNDPVWVERTQTRLSTPLSTVTDEHALTLCSMRGVDQSSSDSS